jgi:hypothetical protein
LLEIENHTLGSHTRLPRAGARAWQVASISASPTDSSTRRTVELDATTLNSAG